MKERTYIAIDLKSFYASVECRERGLDPLRTNLVVADLRRTEKTICLAVTPSLKSYGISGRARLFEVVERVAQVNADRKSAIRYQSFHGKSADAVALAANPYLELSYVVAPPRMALYITYSTRIYHIYLRYIAPEDIHVYSVDEVFMDVTDYLELYQMNARELAILIISDVLAETGITATAGIGPNLYLCKIAMDIVAKKMPADQDGVRIAELSEKSYRKTLWTHSPITDFWRVGSGYMRKLYSHGLFTMGDIAVCSLYNEELLYRMFGVNAQLLIDHAWGIEPVRIHDIKSYIPENNSLGTGQVLSRPYDYAGGRLIVREMADHLALDLVERCLVTDQLVLTVSYDRDNLRTTQQRKNYTGAVRLDHYGRRVPVHGHGTIRLHRLTSSGRLIMEAADRLYEQIVNPALLIRRCSIVAGHVMPERHLLEKPSFSQLNLFTDSEDQIRNFQKETENLQRERRLMRAVLDSRKKYGKNAVLKGMNLLDGATMRERNTQIGGHAAGEQSVD